MRKQIEKPEKSRRTLKWFDAYCHACGERLNSWDARVSKAMSYKNLTCEKCIAKEYGRSTEDVRDIMLRHFGEFPCLGI